MSPPRTHRMTCKQGLGQSAQGRFGTPVLGEHGMPSLGRWDGQQYPRCINSQPGEDPAPGRCSRGCTCQLGGQLGLRKGGQGQAGVRAGGNHPVGGRGLKPPTPRGPGRGLVLFPGETYPRAAWGGEAVVRPLGLPQCPQVSRSTWK